MKKLIASLLLLGVTCVAFPQGTVNFNNRVGSSPNILVDAPISYAPGGSKPSGRIDGGTAMAGLFAGPDGATEAELVLVGFTVGFRTGIAAGYVNVGAEGARTINGVPAGSFAMVQIRAWDTFGFPPEGAASGYFGRSNVLRIATGGDGSPTANLIGLQAFSIHYVPEPGTTALAFLGAAGVLAMIRRRLN